MEEKMMKRFEFDYEISNYKDRVRLFYDYLESLTIEEYEELNKNSTYLDRISDYLLFALDKDLIKKEFSLTENQYRMLCEYAVGRKPYIKQVERDARVSKNMAFERTEENKRRIIKQLGNLFLLDDNIKAYHDMVKKTSMNSKQIKEVTADISDCKKASRMNVVKSKDESVSHHDKLYDLDVMDKLEYNLTTVKEMLRNIIELKNSRVGTTAHCIYLDLEIAIKKCKFTKNQKMALEDYMNGISFELIDTRTLNCAVEKILKKL